MSTERRPPLSLADLPDDILFLVLRELDTARDVASISLTCRRLYQFMQGRGWRSFALQSFPWLRPAARPRVRDDHEANSSDSHGGNSRTACQSTRSDWSRVAQSLTWQSRAWDRRALSFQALLPRGNLQTRQRRQASFRPPLAVHFQPDGDSIFDGEEMVVWGAGEDVVARYRSRGRSSRRPSHQTDANGNTNGNTTGDKGPVATWQVFDGKRAGFRPGYDDVCSIAVIPHALGQGQPRRRGILAGRDSGDLSLFSGETDGTFGQLLARLRPDAESTVDSSRLYSLDVSAGGHKSLIAATTPSHVLFYSASHDDQDAPAATSAPSSSSIKHGKSQATKAVDIPPTAVFDMAGIGLDSSGTRRAYNAKWMAADGMLALGMVTADNPISYLSATPSGFTLSAAAKNDRLVQRFGEASLPLSSSASSTLRTLLPSSLEPVQRSAITGGIGQLLLSSWSDGCIRLQDLRTPSPWDLVYEDRIQLVIGSQALLSWGSERFVAGSQEDAALVIFDFRWPRRYYHTASLPCSGRLPFPNPPEIDRLFVDHYARSLEPRHHLPPVPPLRARCDHLAGHRCRWHATSELLLYRPNCNLFLRRSVATYVPNPIIWSLARATHSDVAPANFYAGLNGCIVEGSLFGEDDAGGADKSAACQNSCDRYFGYPDVLDQLPPSLVPPPPPGQMSASTWRQQQRETTKNHHYYRTIDMHVPMFESGDGVAVPAGQRSMLPLPRMRFSRPSMNNSGHGYERPIIGTANDSTQRNTGNGNGNGNGNGAAGKSNLVQRLKPPSDLPLESCNSPDLDLRRLHRLDAIYHEDSDFEPLHEFEKSQRDAAKIWKREVERTLEREKASTQQRLSE